MCLTCTHIFNISVGGIFLLAAVAVAQLRGHVQARRMTCDMLIKLNHVIRCPHPCKKSIFLMFKEDILIR